MEIKDLRSKTVSELDKHVGELRREQFNLRMQRGTGQLTQTHQIRNVRREIARTKMVLGQKK
jgi:large subunit ribosomal protein L29